MSSTNLGVHHKGPTNMTEETPRTAKSADFAEVRAKIIELNLWACKHGIPLVVFAVSEGKILSAEHVECEAGRLVPEDAATATAVRQALVAALESVVLVGDARAVHMRGSEGTVSEPPPGANPQRWIRPSVGREHRSRRRRRTT